MKCHRLECQESATCEIVLKIGKDEQTFHLCVHHYLQCVAVCRGIEIITNGEMLKEVQA